MAKNSPMASTAQTAIKITRDKSFKDIIRFKGIAAIVLKFAIREFREKSLTEIARLIVDSTRHHKEDMTDAEILDDEIDFLPSEAGVRGEKQTFNDAVFKVLIAEVETPVSLSRLKTELTVNTEMQVKTSNLGYNLISRAVYYGASLLRDTVTAGDTYYTGLHKVYTIWLCNEPLRDLELNEDIKDKYIHTYSFRRNYENYKYVYTDDAADLIDVVMVELPKLKKEDSEAARLMYKLFNETKSIVTEIENTEHVELAKAREGLGMVIDYEARLKEDVAEAVAEAVENTRAEDIRISARMLRKGNHVSTSAKDLIVEAYPDVDSNIIEAIVSEVYNQ